MIRADLRDVAIADGRAAQLFLKPMEPVGRTDADRRSAVRAEAPARIRAARQAKPSRDRTAMASDRADGPRRPRIAAMLAEAFRRPASGCRSPAWA